MTNDFIQNHADSYLRWVKQKPCCVTGSLKPDTHQLVRASGRKTNIPSFRHFTVVPICREKHIELHSVGITLFEQKYKTSLWEVCFNNLLKYSISKVDKPNN